MSTSGGYHEYIEGIPRVHRGDITIHVGGYHDTCGGYHEHIEGCPVRRSFQCKSKVFINLLPHMNHDIPRCTQDIPPTYSWYPQDLLNTPDVLNIPRCTEYTLYRVVLYH